MCGTSSLVAVAVALHVFSLKKYKHIHLNQKSKQDYSVSMKRHLFTISEQSDFNLACIIHFAICGADKLL
jgi:hypothetical protein